MTSTDRGAPVRVRLTVTGVVQGVGFRPHVHRLATARALSGLVGNDSASVFIEVEGAPADVAWFEDRLVAEAPPLARIDAVTTEPLAAVGGSGFAIVESERRSGVRTFVPPDVAVCDDCLAELFDPTDHRYRYPFITCTNCGPRFTIITALPYDRPNTTMAGFAMCDRCSSQYHDPRDRRFHAQPLACADCGPRIRYESPVGETPSRPAVGSDDVVAAVQRDLAGGAIVAIKGLGGHHLACDASTDAAIEVLRRRKGRVDKPFAVMVADLGRAEEIVELTDAERAALTSPARPIVLAERRRGSLLSPLVAPGNPRVGVMLPYAPLHHLLFRQVPGVEARCPPMLVMTSGNRSDEPLAYDDADARQRLAGLADSLCGHDRPIHVPCDDSVLRIVDGREVPIRRSRGYAPLPVRLPVEVRPTLAVGGELKNTFCVADGSNAWVSQHIGDMGNLETLAAFERSVDLFGEMYAVDPATVAADAHPGYLTRRWADDRVDEPRLVQHHHAHVAALMAEHGETGGRRILGVAFDGTGYGLDGSIWGGEFLLADYDGFERCASLAPFPLPGGDAAIRRPSRTALAVLWAAGVPWDDHLAPVSSTDPDERAALASMLRSGTSCVPTSSMGRLFDAVSSLLGVRHEITYEAQAAIELEHLAARGTALRSLPFSVGDGRIDARDVVRGLVGGLALGEPVEDLAAAFHASTVEMVRTVAAEVRERHGTAVVGLAGGVFQNALLTEATASALAEDGFEVLLHRVVPPNDGGLALGQAIVAGRHPPANS